MRHPRRHTARAISFSGTSTRAALRLARTLGCSVKEIEGTGEKRITHPSVPYRVTINARRHDAGRKLTTFLRRVALLTGTSASTPHPAAAGRGNGDGDGTTAPVLTASSCFDRDRAHDLMPHFGERFQFSIEQFLAEASLSWGIMKLQRLLTGEQHWTPELIAPFVPVIANRTALRTSDVWEFLGGTSLPDALVELCRCNFCHATKSHMQRLNALIDHFIVPGTTWTGLAKTTPAYWMPERPMRRSLRAWASTSDAARDAVHLWMRPSCHIRHKILPVDPDQPGLCGVGLLIEDSFITSLAGSDMLRLLNAEDFSDLMSSVANDLVGHYGNVIAPIDREMLNVEPSVARWFGSVEDVLLFDDQLMIFRKPDAAVWFTCARMGDSERDHFLDERVAAISLLRDAVSADGWDASRSFRWLDGFY